MKLYLAGPTPTTALAISLVGVNADAPQFHLPQSFPVFQLAPLLVPCARRPYSVELADLAQDDSGDASRVLMGGAL